MVGDIYQVPSIIFVLGGVHEIVVIFSKISLMLFLLTTTPYVSLNDLSVASYSSVESQSSSKYSLSLHPYNIELESIVLTKVFLGIIEIILSKYPSK